MKKVKNNKMIKNFSIVLLFTLSIEILFRLISHIKIGDISMIRVLIGYSIMALIISFILSWFNKTISKIAIIGLSFAFSLYAFLQMGFNNFIGVYMSFNTSSQLGAVADYIRDFLASFSPSYYIVFIPFILLVVGYLISPGKKAKNPYAERRFFLKKRTRYEYQIRVLSTLILVGLLGFGYYATLKVKFMQNELQVISNYDLFKNPSVPSIVVNEFGILGFGVLDLKSQFIESEEEVIYSLRQNKYSQTTRSFDDTLWQEVTKEEKNTTFKNIDNYLLSRPITDYNDYTGIFEGKNLIVIMMESVNDIFINQEDFPNFYKLYSEGWHWENNYSPRNDCATGNNEMSTMTSLYSILNTCTANKYKNNTYFTSIFNLFNKAGYKTFSAHDYLAHYYDRDEIHKNMGSGRYYDVQDLGMDFSNEYENWASDEDFLVKVLDVLDTFDKNDKVMSFLTTVTSHQPYTSTIEGDYYLDLFSDEDLPINVKRYKSKLTYLDKGLGALIEGLEKRGKLADTVIVLFGDHYPYGLKVGDTNYVSYVLDYDLSDYEVERVPFVIYNSELGAKTFKEYTSYINILPTVANLFALNYDPRLYMGTDVLSEEYESRVVFADGSWKNADVYYNASDGTLKQYSSREYTVDEIRNINEEINAKIQMSRLIIKNNYFADLEAKLNKKQEEKKQELTLANAGMEEK